MPRNKYAALNAAQKADFLKLTPVEWERYFKKSSLRTLNKIYGQLCQRPHDPEWERIKDMFVAELQRRQAKRTER